MIAAYFSQLILMFVGDDKWFNSNKYNPKLSLTWGKLLHCVYSYSTIAYINLFPNWSWWAGKVVFYCSSNWLVGYSASINCCPSEGKINTYRLFWLQQQQRTILRKSSSEAYRPMKNKATKTKNFNNILLIIRQYIYLTFSLKNESLRSYNAE